ncbi:MAG: hypothetical protein AB2813_02980, partial [Candidatus Sedimenticola endophacoides]
PEQALAVYEFIDELRDALWARYEVQLIEQIKLSQVMVSHACPPLVPAEGDNLRHLCAVLLGR